MKNITKQINDYIKLNNPDTEAFDTIYNDMFPDADGEFVISRHDPSQAKEISYIDGSSEGVLNVAYYARSADASVCRDLLNIIINCVDNAIIDNEGVSIELSANQLPSFVGTDEKENSIYTATVKAAYLRK